MTKRLILYALAASAIAGIATEAQTPAPLVPPPASVIGFEPCADYSLATYEQIAEYFRVLDASSERIQLIDIGPTAEGRTQLMAIISSEANMRRLDHFKTVSRRLALSRDLSDAQARELAAEGRAIVWIDFGLHSTEVAHAQTAPLMAHHAVTDESAEMQAIRDNVIFLLLPNMNPDGTTLVADWYMRHVGTPFEQTSPPELYQKYAGHDNNRDWFMFNLAESRNVATQLYDEWFPQIVYNQHQSAPFPARIFVPPFADPMNPNIPPLVMRGVNLIGEAMTRRLDREGKTGAISRIDYDTWWNGGMRSAVYYHNMLGILTETAHPTATPSVYDATTFPDAFSDGRPTLSPTAYYPNPYRGGEWHLRDSCDYMMTASMAVLDLGATRRSEWLYNIYAMGQDAIEAGRGEVYVVSRDQWDPGSAVKLVNALRWGGVEITRTTRSLRIGATEYPPNSFVIRGDQSFRPYLTDLLNPQVYPEMRRYPGGPPGRPYDITGWTLPLQMGVTVDRHVDVNRMSELPPDALVPVARAELGATRMPTSTGFAYALDPRRNDSFIAINRLLADHYPVYRSQVAVSVEGATWPAGTFIVPMEVGVSAAVEAATADLGLVVETVGARPNGQLTLLTQPRIGLYRGWGANADEGWTRLVLEAFEFPYISLFNDDLRHNRLSDLDVILLPDATYRRMLTGLGPRAAPPVYQGGMTPRGVSNLYEFVDAGGTLVAFNTANELPLADFGLPIVDVAVAQSPSDHYVPGTILKLLVDSTHPVGYGMPSLASGFFARGPAFSVETASAHPGGNGGGLTDPYSVSVVARYPERDLLLSGWILGEHVLTNQAAVVEARLGSGRVVLLGLRVQHRGQTHGTFKLLFNSLFLGMFH